MYLRQKITDLLAKSYVIRISDLKLSIKLSLDALELCKDDKLKDLKAKAFSQLSIYYMITGSYEKSTSYTQLSIQLFEELGDEIGIADSKSNFASLHYKSNNFHIAMIYLIDSLNIYKKYNQFQSISKCEKAIGTIYDCTGDITKAVKSYKNAIKAATKIDDTNLISNAYNNLSGSYLKLDKINLAEDLINKSIVMKTLTNDIRGLSYAIYGRGKVKFAKKQYEEALNDFKESIKIHQEMGDQMGLSMSYHKMARLYFDIKNFEEAKIISIRCLEICKKYDISLNKFKCFYLLYEIYKENKENEKALENLELFLKEKEALINVQTLKVIENYDLLIQMKFMQKEAELQAEKSKMFEIKNKTEEASRIRQEFLSKMSHEIRTPLNAITTIITMLDDKEDPEEIKLINSLKFSSKHLMHIINDILDFTKLDLGKMTLELFPCNLFNFLTNFSQLYKTQAKEKNIKFDLKIDPRLSEMYLIDETKTNQIISNLIGNSIKFTDHGFVALEVIVLKKQLEYDEILFKITDSGEGIEPENLSKIFDSFSQIKNVITRKKGGTGLGLAIVKNLIELHDSTITVKSKMAKGTEFSFVLKLKKLGNTIDKIELKEKVKLNDLKVLLAEDNQINAMIAIKLLSKWGIISEHAVNGIQAVEMAKTKKYDLILMDIHMPEMDGFIASKLIRENCIINNSTPIIGLTADISARDNLEYSPYFKEFLLKPLDIEKLYNSIGSSIIENIF